MAKTLRQQVDRIGEKQRAAVRRAILEMRREGVELTRDRLRQRAEVDNNAATVLLAAYRAGAFEVLDDEPARPATPALDPRDRFLRLGPRAQADLESGRYTFPVTVDEALDPTGLELSAASHMLAMLSYRRKRAVLRFAQLMIEAELHDLPALNDANQDLDDQLEAIGLDPSTFEPVDGEDDAGLRALEAMTIEDVAAWDAPCRGQAPARTKPARARR